MVRSQKQKQQQQVILLLCQAHSTSPAASQRAHKPGNSLACPGKPPDVRSGTERGTLPSSIQFNPVVILTATPVQDICLDLQVILSAKPNSRLDEPGFSCSKVISNPSPDMKPNNSDTCQVQISNYLTLFLLGRDRRSSSEHARSHQLPCSLLSPRDKAKAGTEPATGISLPIFPSQLPSILHSVLLVSL